MADPVVLLARGWEVKLNNVVVNGLKTIKLSPGAKEADITTQSSGDYDEHLIARRTMEITLEGYRLEASDGSRDPGQAAVEALAEQIDYASLGQWTLTSPGGEERKFKGSVTMSDLGGEIDEGQAWGCKIKQSGPLLP